MEIQHGLGTYTLLDKTYDIVKNAIELGCRHIDTAQIYKNEDDVGKAIRESNIPRKDFFVTTKINPKYIVKGRKGIINGIKRSLEKLNIEYIDLLLIHKPIEIKLIESWEVLEDIIIGEKEDIQELKGKIRNIGVSNYKISHLDIILNGNRITPYCNQIEIHPYLQRHELKRYCEKRNIKIVAYCSLLQGTKHDGILKSIADKYNMKVAEILIQWAIINKYIVIPRTTDIKHLRQNIESYKSRINYEVYYELNRITEHYSLFPKYL